MICVQPIECKGYRRSPADTLEETDVEYSLNGLSVVSDASTKRDHGG